MSALRLPRLSGLLLAMLVSWLLARVLACLWASRLLARLLPTLLRLSLPGLLGLAPPGLLGRVLSVLVVRGRLLGATGLWAILLGGTVVRTEAAVHRVLRLSGLFGAGAIVLR